MRAADLNFPYPVLGDANAMTGDLPEVAYTPDIPPKEMITVPYRWTFEINLKNADILKLIEEGKKFSSKYAEAPYPENNCYYIDAKDRFYKEFNDAETFDAQVEVVSQLIDDVCLYYLK